METKTGSLAAMVATTLLWAVLWALPGGVIEAVDNIAPAAHSFTRQVDMWMQTLGLPGLLAGALFSVLLLITERGRRLAELSPARSGGWGAVSGLAVGAFVVWGVAPGLSEPWQLAAGLVGLATLMGAASGAATPLLFGVVARRRASVIH